MNWIFPCIRCGESVPDETAGEFDIDGATCFECLKEDEE